MHLNYNHLEDGVQTPKKQQGSIANGEKFAFCELKIQIF